jgi:MFS family permease
MQAVALGILVTAQTHNPLWTGLVAAAAFLPNGLLAPFGGALADRLDRRRWLLLTTVAEMGCATLLAVLSAIGDAPPAVAVAVAFLGGMASAIGLPAYQAMLPDLVEHREDLLAAVSLSSAQYNLGRVIGPALAGIVLALGSYSLAFACNAASVAAVVVALLLVRLPAIVVDAQPTAILHRIAEGARLAMGEPACRSAILLIAVVALLASPFIALVPAMAIEGLHLGSGHRGSVGTSVLVTAQGVGAVAGALLLPGLAQRFGRARQVVVALVALPLVLLAYGLAPGLWPAAATLLLLGFVYIAVLSGLSTVVQLHAPSWARGRVISLFMLSLGTVYPVGAIVQGAIGARTGVREVTAGSAVLLLAALALVVLRWPNALRALGTSPPETPAPEPS